MSGVQEEPVENRGLGGKNWGAEARAEHMETGAFEASKAAGRMELSCQASIEEEKKSTSNAILRSGEAGGFPPRPRRG